jgi:hypothetical protein
MFSKRIKLLFALAYICTTITISAQQASPPTQSIAPVVMKDHRSGKALKDSRTDSSIDTESIQESRIQLSTVQGNAVSASSNAQIQWLNDYQLKRNIFLSNDGKISISEKNELQRIITDSKKSINGTFAYSYMQLRESRNKSESNQYLEEAIKLDPNNKLLLTEVAWLAERKSDIKTRNKAIDTYILKGGITEFQLKFADWIISSTPSNSLIVCHGENDAYPLWKANQSNHIIVSLAMLEDLSWLNATLSNWDKSIQFKEVPTESQFLLRVLQSQKPAYLLWTLRPELLNPLADNLFPIGPAIEFTNKSNDNLIKLKRFYFSESFKKYVLGDFWINDIYSPTMANLIPGIRMLLTSTIVSDSERRFLKQMEERIIINSRSK